MISKKEIKKFILENCVGEDGEIDLSDLDFSDFNGDIYINRWKVKKSLFQNRQKVECFLHQDNQQVGRNLFQDTEETIKKMEYLKELKKLKEKYEIKE